MATQDSFTTLNHLFFHALESPRERLLTGAQVYSTQQFVQAVFALRKFLLDSGLTEGDRVVILAENRPEWHIADFATLLGRMIVVPIYTGLALSQVRYLLEHSDCRAVVVSGAKQWEIMRTLLPGFPGIRCVIGMQAGEEEKIATSLPEIIRAAVPATSADWDQIRAEALGVSPDTVASIVYTSGTTGIPKGVMLTHANIMFDVGQCVNRLQFRTVSQALSVLPLPHIFERLLCYGYFRMGVPIAYGDPHNLRDLLRQHKPEVMGCVPRVLEKVQEAVESQVRVQPARRQAIFRAMLAAGLACTRRTAASEPVALKHRLLHPLAKILVFSKIRRQLGGLGFFICGGAWLNPAVEEFFRAIGFDLIQGYGLTETSPVIALNAIGSERTGSVGRPLDGVEVQIDENGEILTRGPHVMKGYYREPEDTREALRDGWLRTGDLGTLDPQGFLSITGRKKEILVLSTGKNVCPVLAEQALQNSPFVQAAFAVGDGFRFLTALIVPHRAHLDAFARSRGIAFECFEQILEAREVMTRFHEEFASLQAGLAPFEQVKRFCFLPEEALLDPELMTPTQKVRRSVLHQRYSEWIQKMYSQEEPPAIVIPAFSRTEPLERAQVHRQIL